MHAHKNRDHTLLSSTRCQWTRGRVVAQQIHYTLRLSPRGTCRYTTTTMPPRCTDHRWIVDILLVRPTHTPHANTNTGRDDSTIYMPENTIFGCTRASLILYRSNQSSTNQKKIETLVWCLLFESQSRNRINETKNTS